MVRDLTPEEAERLRREHLANTLLWPLTAMKDRLQLAVLLGGQHVQGAPAMRFELPGDGDCEAWLFRDGSPAGGRWRDPLRKAKVEWHVRGEQLRVVVDGKLETGWTCSLRKVTAIDEAWFRREG